MQITFGNPSPPAPCPGPNIVTTGVTDAVKSDGSGEYVAEYTIGSDPASVKDHLFDNPTQVTHLPGNGLVVEVTRSFSEHSLGRPTFVSVNPQGRDPENAADLERFLSEFYRCDRGIPADVEDNYYTENGPPGTGPVVEGE